MNPSSINKQTNKQDDTTVVVHATTHPDGSVCLPLRGVKGGLVPGNEEGFADGDGVVVDVVVVAAAAAFGGGEAKRAAPG